MSVLKIRSHSRYAVRSEAILDNDDRKALACLLIELSQDGARISGLGAQSLREGEEVTLTTDHAVPIKAIVRWSDNGRAGLRLTQPLHVTELSDFVAAARKAVTAAVQVA